jgi:hypothetical protein
VVSKILIRKAKPHVAGLLGAPGGRAKVSKQSALLRSKIGNDARKIMLPAKHRSAIARKAGSKLASKLRSKIARKAGAGGLKSANQPSAWQVARKCDKTPSNNNRLAILFAAPAERSAGWPILAAT